MDPGSLFRKSVRDDKGRTKNEQVGSLRVILFLLVIVSIVAVRMAAFRAFVMIFRRNIFATIEDPPGNLEKD